MLKIFTAINKAAFQTKIPISKYSYVFRSLNEIQCSCKLHVSNTTSASQSFTRGTILGQQILPATFLSNNIFQSRTLYTSYFATNKHLSALQSKKRVSRKKTQLKNDSNFNASPGQHHWDVVAYATGEEYDLDQLSKFLQNQGLYQLTAMPEDIHDVLHVSAKYQVDREPREIYFFSEGSVVFWNTPQLECQNVVKCLRDFENNSYEEAQVMDESERMIYSYTEVFNQTRLMEGRILLHSEGSTDLEKYTFSNAMALSVKLGIWEASLDKYVDSIEFVSEDLKKGAKIRMTQQEVLRKTGELFALRHLINLSSDLLDTPDFYWDRENLEALYNKTCNHLNISKRTRVMNEKLNHCCELVELLRSHINDHHHVRLEWMIIILILVEVAFETLHFCERYATSSDSSIHQDQSKLCNVCHEA